MKLDQTYGDWTEQMAWGEVIVRLVHDKNSDRSTKKKTPLLIREALFSGFWERKWIKIWFWDLKKKEKERKKIAS